MTKQEAIDLFGGKVAHLAKAVGIRRASVYSWPERLTERLTDRVIAAAVRAGKDPRRLLLRQGQNKCKAA